MAGPRLMGPVLLLRGWTQDSMTLAVLTVTAAGTGGPGSLTLNTVRADGRRVRSAAAPVAPVALLRHPDGRVLWRHDVRVPCGPGAKGGSRTATYGIGDDGPWTVHLPSPDGPLRIAYTSCNGTEDQDDLPRHLERQTLWQDLARCHAVKPFHLLIQGGDQAYCDGVWACCPELDRWRRGVLRRGRWEAPFTEGMADQVDAYYFDRYVDLWAYPATARVLAEVPSLMMWDDHDIFDGWGSHPFRRHRSPVYQGVFHVAKRHFAAFQLGLGPGERLGAPFLDRYGRHHGWALRVGPVGILAPDLRSERGPERMMGPAGWGGVDAALDNLAGVRDLFIVSSVPFLGIGSDLLERLYVLLPGDQHYQDDLRDQWQSYAHRAEWRRFTKRLLQFMDRSRARITVLSGEIHLGARAVLTAPGGRLHQLISSGIVHPPPNRFVAALFDVAGRRRREILPGVRYAMEPIPGFGKRFLADRNWLELEGPPDQPWHAVWHAERRGVSQTLVLD